MKLTKAARWKREEGVDVSSKMVSDVSDVHAIDEDLFVVDGSRDGVSC